MSSTPATGDAHRAKAPAGQSTTTIDDESVGSMKGVGNRPRPLERSDAPGRRSRGQGRSLTDVKKLTHLLEYLISAGWKRRGQELPHVQISAERKGREWVLSFHEDGLRVAPIDLAICKKMVERYYGGRMWADSDSSAIYFAIPDTKGSTTEDSRASDASK